MFVNAHWQFAAVVNIHSCLLSAETTASVANKYKINTFWLRTNTFGKHKISPQ